MADQVLARPERLELPAYWFEASRSIQLSYGRTGPLYKLTVSRGEMFGNVSTLFRRSLDIRRYWLNNMFSLIGTQAPREASKRQPEWTAQFGFQGIQARPQELFVII